MDDFLRFFDEKSSSFPMHLYIGYGKISDWTIYIVKQGMAYKYPNARHSGEDVVIADISECDMELAFAKAQVALKEWLSEFESGY